MSAGKTTLYLVMSMRFLLLETAVRGQLLRTAGGDSCSFVPGTPVLNSPAGAQQWGEGGGGGGSELCYKAFHESPTVGMDISEIPSHLFN